MNITAIAVPNFNRLIPPLFFSALILNHSVFAANSDGSVHHYQKILSTEGGFTGVLESRDYFGFGVTKLGDGDGGPDRGAVWILFLNPDGTVKCKRGKSGFI